MKEKNIMIRLSYNGSGYCGWQKQKNGRSIQGELEYAVKEVFRMKDVDIIGSGRTDAGVHALAQVANFRTCTSLPVEKIPEILNNRLPKDISVTEAMEVDEDFHSRYSAHRKTYRYQIYPSRIRNPFYKDFSYQVKYSLDIEKMKEEAQHLVGIHDFAGFMSQGSSVKSTVREIYRSRLYEKDGLLVYEVEGNGFLYNMVRIIAGTLVDIGRGHIKESMEDIIKSVDRDRAGHTAPAHGLFLKEVVY